MARLYLVMVFLQMVVGLKAAAVIGGGLIPLKQTLCQLPSSLASTLHNQYIRASCGRLSDTFGAAPPVSVLRFRYVSLHRNVTRDRFGEALFSIVAAR